MPFVSLNDESGNVPGRDDLRFLEVLIVEVEALDSVEQVDNFLLSLALVKFLVDFAWWPVFQLEKLTDCEKAYNSRPLLLGEALNCIEHFK